VSLRGAAAAAGLILVACTDHGRPPGPGSLTATLRSPNGSEGAAVVLLAGVGVSEIRPIGETEVYSFPSGDETRVVLVNQVGGTLAFELVVADRRGPLVGVVTEVAGPDDVLRTDLSDYALEIAP
jgi:hypothetical protein